MKKSLLLESYLKRLRLPTISGPSTRVWRGKPPSSGAAMKTIC